MDNIEAHNLGYEAFLNGERRRANPFSDDKDFRDLCECWRAGWLSAQHDNWDNLENRPRPKKRTDLDG